MDVGPAELIIILVIVALLFGPGRIANLGGELGKAIHEFRDGLQQGGQPENAPAAEQPAEAVVPVENASSESTEAGTAQQ